MPVACLNSSLGAAAPPLLPHYPPCRRRVLLQRHQQGAGHLAHHGGLAAGKLACLPFSGWYARLLAVRDEAAGSFLDMPMQRTRCAKKAAHANFARSPSAYQSIITPTRPQPASTPLPVPPRWAWPWAPMTCARATCSSAASLAPRWPPSSSCRQMRAREQCCVFQHELQLLQQPQDKTLVPASVAADA